MAATQRALLGAIVGILAGCATTSGGHHDTIAVTGKVVERHAASSAAVSGTYVQGSHNPLHKLVSDFAAEPAHTIYVIQPSNGLKRYVRDKAVFDVGNCVEVRTSKEKMGEESWKLGEATLSISGVCGA